MMRNRRLAWIVTAAAWLGCAEASDPPAPLDLPAPLRNTIVFVAEHAGTRHLFTLQPDGGRLTQLTRRAEGLRSGPGVSPDGRWIVAAALRDSMTDLWVMGSDGSSFRRLTHSRATESSPVWSPDGTRIAFAADKDGEDDIFVIDADGTSLRQLTDDRNGDWSPQWSPDGELLLFSSVRGQDTALALYRMRPDGSEPARLTDDPADAQLGVWAPDGRTVAFGSTRDRTNGLYLLDVASGGVDRVTDGGYFFGHAWSPDGRELLVTRTHEGSSNLYRMRRDGSDIRRLDAGRGVVWATWVP